MVRSEVLPVLDAVSKVTVGRTTWKLTVCEDALSPPTSVAVAVNEAVALEDPSVRKTTSPAANWAAVKVPFVLLMAEPLT